MGFGFASRTGAGVKCQFGFDSKKEFGFFVDFFCLTTWNSRSVHRDVFCPNKTSMSARQSPAFSLALMSRSSHPVLENPAIENGQRAIVRQLSDANVKSGSKFIPLYRAAEEGECATVHLLLVKGADANVTTSAGLTPLFAAAVGGHIPVVQILLENRADVNARTINGHYPLDGAVQWGHLTVTHMLLNKGADINAKANDVNPTPKP